MTARRSRMPMRALASAGSLALLTTAAIASSAPSASAENDPGEAGTAQSSQEFLVGQFNIWGSVAHNAVADTGGNGIVSAIARSVEDREPLLLTMQEVCENQVEHLAERLDGYDYAFGPAYGDLPSPPWRGPKRCGGDENPDNPRYGNAVLFNEDYGFAAHDDNEVGRHNLAPHHGHEHRTMVCTPSEELQVVACASHLSAGSGDAADTRRNNEAVELSNLLRNNYSGYEIVLGIDTNMEPDVPSMRALYHTDYYESGPGSGGGNNGTRGQLRELMSDCGNETAPSCRTGDYTFGAVSQSTRQRTGEPDRKIDYLFASPAIEVRSSSVTSPSPDCGNPRYEDPLDPTWGTPTISCSDHELLWAEVAVPN